MTTMAKTITVYLAYIPLALDIFYVKMLRVGYKITFSHVLNIVEATYTTLMALQTHDDVVPRLPV